MFVSSESTHIHTGTAALKHIAAASASMQHLCRSVCKYKQQLAVRIHIAAASASLQHLYSSICEYIQAQQLFYI